MQPGLFYHGRVLSQFQVRLMSRRWLRTIQIVILLLVILSGYTLFADNNFESWKEDFRAYAIANGIQAGVVDTALHGLLPDQKVINLGGRQPESSSTIWAYLDFTVTPERIEAGRRMYAEHTDLLLQLSSRYGVSSDYLLAIWGLETRFGQSTGDYSTIRSLASLAFGGREDRRGFWREQLMAALRILQRGDIDPGALRGSWAGAIGHTQFIPTTFEHYAVDFDHDGQRNLKGSIADALASTANYLAHSGWTRGQRWGFEVRLPADFDWSLADPEIWKNLPDWQALGVEAGSGSFPSSSDPASLFLPAGYRGPAFLIFANFNALLKYNSSSSYALAVGLLADRIRGGPGLQASWPREEKALSSREKTELQELLSAAGYSTEGVDGLIGPNTRAALKRWQSDVGFPPDGYATAEHLRKLREQVELSHTSHEG